LDFNTFVIAGPSTSTYTVGFESGGSNTVAAGAPYTLVTQCLTDTFSMTGVPGGTPPTICGTNTGYHMYADASSSCNQLNFQLGNAGVGTTIPTRQWNIKITQISCYDTNLPPSGCTQYFYGPTSGTLYSFNYANSVELANQNQNICMRRERGYCKICFSATATADFQISGKASLKGFIAGSKCCAYGKSGKGSTSGYDCVIIPGAMKITSPNLPVNNQAFCGAGGLAYSTATSKTGGKTVCTTQTPFQLNFLSDAFSYAIARYKGFKLVYWETTC